MHENLTMTNARIDLHIHSTCSDGLLTPAEIISVAQRRGLRAISITDHDTVAATTVAVELGLKAHLDVVPGIEIGVAHRGCDVHLLGYFIDATSRSLKGYAELLMQSREGRAREIVRVLQRQGIKIPYEMVQQKANGAPIGRPHIAQVLLEEGYVFSSYEAFQKYLGENKAGDIPKLNIGLQRAVQIIKEAGGLAFLAHPVTIGCCEEVLNLLIGYGLDGIETIHPKHTARFREHFGRIARKYDLLESGGSDCHGRDGDISLGTLDIPYSFLEAMTARIR
ncbi:PHP domain-containing protein [candidate division KSB1 bacterium]|nr:PHP domain-containing protein [candidate division KSB1 bacterium]RQW06442.1 MAG: PHP domain-containing protein [candidate division KSB1 bacterium]